VVLLDIEALLRLILDCDDCGFGVRDIR
jgi:hypothetical protein